MITFFLLALVSTALMLCSAPVILFALMLESCHPPARVAVPSSARSEVSPSSHPAPVIV
jgi:hypothetical protein